MKTNRIKRIAMAFRLSFASHRDIIHGISQYAKIHHWQLLFVAAHDASAEEPLTMNLPPDLDGLITCESYPNVIRACSSSADFPIVIIDNRGPSPRRIRRPLGLVDIDDFAIGSRGAEHLCAQGRFRTFGFVSENQRHESLRGQGFAAALNKRNLSVSYYPHPSAKDGSEADREALEKWLSELPKPAAVMAEYDLRASQVLEAAHSAHLSIPEQLSVLGVDNDELLCDFTDPALSSIAPDFLKIGTLAAQTLTQLMRRVREKKIIRSSSSTMRIVKRESTAPIAPSAILVERALSYIKRNLFNGISSKDVVAFLGVSRRLADQRFREVMGKSMLEYILDQRLAAVREKLSSSQLSIQTITSRCGFRNENYAKNLFKKRFGQSMKAYRLRALEMTMRA